MNSCKGGYKVVLKCTDGSFCEIISMVARRLELCVNFEMVKQVEEWLGDFVVSGNFRGG